MKVTFHFPPGTPEGSVFIEHLPHWPACGELVTHPKTGASHTVRFVEHTLNWNVEPHTYEAHVYLSSTWMAYS